MFQEIDNVGGGWKRYGDNDDSRGSGPRASVEESKRDVYTHAPSTSVRSIEAFESVPTDFDLCQPTFSYVRVHTTFSCATCLLTKGSNGCEAEISG